MILDSIDNLGAPEAGALKQIKALFCDPAKAKELAAFVEGKALMFVDEDTSVLEIVPVTNEGSVVV